MPKTVTVEVEIPEGYELAEPKLRPPKKGEWYSFAGGVHTASFDFTGECHVIVRPIAPEQTWERPEWLHESWKWLIHCGGWRLSDYEARPRIYGDEWGQSLAVQTSTIKANVFPKFESLLPAERIWRIVERGEG